MTEPETITITVPTSYPRSLYLQVGAGNLGLAMTYPTSPIAVLLDRAGTTGDIVSWLFAIALSLMAVEWFVTDVLAPRLQPFLTSAAQRRPPRWYAVFARWFFKTVRDYRWLCVCSMATVYWLLATIAMLPGNQQGSWVLIFLYLSYGAWGMKFAWRTKLTKYRAVMAAKCA